MTGQAFLFPLYKLLIFMVLFSLHGVAARVLVSVITTFLWSGSVILPFQRCSVKFSVLVCVYPCSCIRF